MSRLRRSRVLPLAIWAATQVVAPLSRGLAGRLVGLLWFVPWDRRRPSDAPGRLGRGRATVLADRPVTVYERQPLPGAWQEGEAPTALLIHGWADRAASTEPLAGPLIEAGFRVVAVDLPAHGASPGWRTDAFELAAVVRAAIDRWRPDAVVAHSLGGVATVMALTDAPSPVRRLVLLSPAVRLEHAVARFGAELRLSSRVLGALRAELERRFGSEVWQRLAVDDNLRDRPLPGLIVHDRTDRRVDVADARLVAEAWPAARLLETEGLGHNRTLRDPDVIATVVEALTATDGDELDLAG